MICRPHAVLRGVVAAAFSLVSVAACAQGTAQPASEQPQPQQSQQKPFEPVVAQPGKDVIWVPTPQVTVDLMLTLGKVTPADYVIDLGSGDGVTVITAAKKGATAL